MVVMASRIRRARTLAGMSQGELAGKVGVHRSAVTQWEREGGTCPSVEHLSAISVITQVSFEWLATGRGEADTRPDMAVPAIAMEVACDEVETRLLEAMRRLPQNKRMAMCVLLELLA